MYYVNKKFSGEQLHSRVILSCVQFLNGGPLLVPYVMSINNSEHNINSKLCINGKHKINGGHICIVLCIILMAVYALLVYL